MCDVARLQSDRLHAGTVDIEEERWRIEGLLHVDVHRAGNVAHLGGELLSDHKIPLLVRAGDGHVNRCRSSEVQNLRDDIRWLKEKLHAREFAWQLLAQLRDVRGGRLAALLLQLHENLGVGSSERSGVAVSQIDAAVRYADVVQHRDQVFLRDGLFDGLVDLIGQTGGLLNAQARSRAHMQANLSGVY